jgi:hypothetical protein
VRRSNLECSYCGSELEYSDHFGYLALHQSGEVVGYIYKCPNDNCDYGGHFYFYSANPDVLYEGYPC